MMYNIQARLNTEWQALDSLCPEWLAGIVRDDVCYTAVLIMVGANAFVVGLVLGFVLAAVA